MNNFVNKIKLILFLCLFPGFKGNGFWTNTRVLISVMAHGTNHGRSHLPRTSFHHFQPFFCSFLHLSNYPHTPWHSPCLSIPACTHWRDFPSRRRSKRHRCRHITWRPTKGEISLARGVLLKLVLYLLLCDVLSYTYRYILTAVAWMCDSMLWLRKNCKWSICMVISSTVFYIRF